MRKFGKRLLALGVSSCMLASMAGCGQTSTIENNTEVAQTTEESKHKIGVAVYSIEDDEVKMFQEYYNEYIGNAFDVEFVYSDSLASIEDEKNFVDNAKKEGCEGIISFVSYDLPEIVDYCDDLYYTIGSTTFDSKTYEEVKTKENFLGIMSPTIDDEYLAGIDMVEQLGSDNGSSKNWVLLSGGSSTGNFMHAQRLSGMLDKLQTKYGFTLLKTKEELMTAQEAELIAENPEGGKVYLSPGYYMVDALKGATVDTIQGSNTDIVASVCSIQSILDDITTAEETQNKDILIGTVDCFSNNNAEAFNTKDHFGSNKINFVAGKCQAMAAPAFVAMYNAITGHADFIRNNKEAFWLNQEFWSASSTEEYNERMEKANNIYTNIYGTKDIMNVIYIYNNKVTFDDFRTFVDLVNKK